MRVTVTASGEDCGDPKAPPPGQKRYEATYRWHERKQRFVAGPNEVAKLSAANLKRAAPE